MSSDFGSAFNTTNKPNLVNSTEVSDNVFQSRMIGLRLRDCVIICLEEAGNRPDGVFVDKCVEICEVVKSGLYMGVAGNKDRVKEIKDLVTERFNGQKAPQSVFQIVEFVVSCLVSDDEVELLLAGRCVKPELHLVSVTKRKGRDVVVESELMFVRMGSGAQHILPAEARHVTNETSAILFALYAIEMAIGKGKLPGGIIKCVAVRLENIHVRISVPVGEEYDHVAFDCVKEFGDEFEEDGWALATAIVKRSLNFEVFENEFADDGGY